ncbi:hypothetical protein D1007_15653 [Hordeum vulgare]|nr:hypothetical protein D1007_15653 [Hordeum vulgare]
MSAMFLTQGWKSFARSRGLGPGNILQCRFDGTTTRTLKFSRASNVPAECCVESYSGSNFDSSSDSNEDTSVFSIKEEYSD